MKTSVHCFSQQHASSQHNQLSQPARRPQNHRFKPSETEPHKKESDEFRYLLKGEHHTHIDDFDTFCFKLIDEHPSEPTEETPQHPVFHPIMSDVLTEIEKQEHLPAEFSLILPGSGEIVAKMQQGESGETVIALGFTDETLSKLLGFEKQGENLMSRRLGKPVRLQFKRIEAL